MKYIFGSMIISFGLLLVCLIVLTAAGFKAPDDLMKYLGISWVILSIVLYPVARKIVRD